MLECGAQVRATVRALARGAPLSRLPIELTVADVRDQRRLDEAVAGCDVVFHCARGNDGSPHERREVDVDGTRNLLEAAARAGVRRFVHTSTVVVYELPRAGTLDEHAPYGSGGDAYAEGKRAGERIVLEHAERLAVTVLQPTVVYGPGAGVYGRDVLEELRATRIPLVDGGAGICNALYVDDLVTAMLLAATGERAPGETFLVTGPEHPTWAEFFGAFEDMLGLRRTVSMSEADALAHWKRATRPAWLIPEALRALRGDAALRRRLLETREGSVVRRLAERILPSSFFAPERWVERTPHDPEAEPPVAAFKPDVVRFLSSRARVSNDKARELLGYRPVFGLADGMRLTEAWARWEGLIPEQQAK